MIDLLVLLPRRFVLLVPLVVFGFVVVLVFAGTAAAQSGDVITPQTDLAMWSLLVGTLMPALVAVVQQPGWPNWVRAFVGVAASIVAGFVTTWLTESGALWDQGMVHAILLVGIASWAAHQSFWKPTSISPTIEAKTSAAPPQ